MAGTEKAWRYVVRCDLCDREAMYKVAAVWSDGLMSELKTYALACAEHVAELYERAQRRRGTYRPSAPEQIGVLGVYVLERGKRDRELRRARELEEQLGAQPAE